MASSAHADDGEDATRQDEEMVRRPYKSFKKKFLKLRHTFRDSMKESNTLYDEEQRARQIASRIQEQNDQLLEMLLDINESKKLPVLLRYDLRSPPPGESDVPDLEPDDSPATFRQVLGAQSALREAKMEFATGQLTASEYERAETNLTDFISKGRNLKTLCTTSHTTVDSVTPKLLADLDEDAVTGYLTTAHEEEYLTALDEFLDSPRPDDQLLPPRPKPNERGRERNMQLHNPVSVSNWLSNHRPKELVGDDEPPHEKPSRSARKSSPKISAATTTASKTNPKRERASKIEDEVLDEDGNLLTGYQEDEGPPKKRKRGQDDDAYRPKGGNSKKRKRASTKTSVTGNGIEATPT